MQNGSSNKVKLSQDLQREEDLNKLYKSEEFRRSLQPLLEAEQTPPLLNPQDYPNQDKFLEAYSLAWGKCKAYQELKKLFADAESRAKKIRELKEKPDRDFSVGN